MAISPYRKVPNWFSPRSIEASSQTNIKIIESRIHYRIEKGIIKSV